MRKQTKTFEQDEPVSKRKKKSAETTKKNERSIMYLRGEYLAIKTEDGMIFSAFLLTLFFLNYINDKKCSLF